jgi:LAO/AO transport system kinase
MSALAEQVLKGDVRALARAATLVENHHPDAAGLMKQLFPHTGKSVVLGVTGSPGAGKSTITDQLIVELRKENQQVGVIAVDPTSPYTGGAILGDRIRMIRHHADAGVFIRSMATRGWLGGLAGATTDLALLMQAAGKQTVIVETVGVGQDEVEVARLADATAVVLVPGMGDDVQAIKAGIMEIADVFVINKADQPGVEQLEREIKSMQSLAMRKDYWVPPIVRTVATEGTGIAEVLAAMRSYLERGNPNERAVASWTLRLKEMLRERALDRFGSVDFAAAAQEVAARRIDPYTLVEQWLTN